MRDADLSMIDKRVQEGRRLEENPPSTFAVEKEDGSQAKKVTLSSTVAGADQGSGNSVGNRAVRSVQHKGAPAPPATAADGGEPAHQPSNTSAGTS